MVSARGGTPGGKPPDDIVLSDEERFDFLEAVARVYPTQAQAETVLSQIRYPRGRLPSWQGLNAMQWWTQVFLDFDAGILPTPYRSLLYISIRLYARNTALRRLAVRHGVVEPEPGEPEQADDTPAQPAHSPFSNLWTKQEEPKSADINDIYLIHSDGPSFIDKMNEINEIKTGTSTPGGAEQRPTGEGPHHDAGTRDGDRVFLCHASQDKVRVRSWYERLQRDGVPAWLDAEDLRPGADWHYEIQRVLEECAAVIVFLSTTSVTKRGYVQREVAYALDVAQEQPEGSPYIFPARLEPCEIPRRLARWHCVDLFHPDGYFKLLKSLRMAT